MRLGIIGGTGVKDVGLPAEPLAVETPWGDVEVAFARDGPLELFFLNRHGTPAGGTPRPGRDEGASRAAKPAHVVEPKANVDALARCNVTRVLALNSVGALHEGLAPGTLLAPHDYVDLRSRKASFFDDSPVHVDASEPYCPELRAALAAAGADHARGVYVATEGPRLETPAEVRMLRQLGGDVVGMTGCPEAGLARERGLCYASLCMVTNPAAGVAGPIDAEAIRDAARALAPHALRTVLDAARRIPSERGCACGRALERARL